MAVVKLSGREIPRDEKGDPAFQDLVTVRHVFSDDEITAMVNRYLYQAFYQLDSHKKRAKAEAERMSPLKKMVRQMFGVSFINATDEQLRAAQQRLDQQKGGTTGQ